MDKDIELMLQSKEDNLEAFGKLYNKYYKVIAAFFFRMGCSLNLTEDYTQEVFLKLWKARKRYRAEAKFTTFLFQIAKNYWLNQIAKKKRRPVTYNFYQTEKQGPYYEKFVYEGKLPQEIILDKELQEKIQEALNKLSEKHRLVFVLSQFEDLKYKEIAKILSIPIGTVKSRMATAEKKVRKFLKSYFNDFEKIEIDG